MHALVGPSPGAPPAGSAVRSAPPGSPREDEWVLPEEDVPESSPHRDTVRLLELILLAFVARTRRNARVAANLACRWDPTRPQIGVDPDVALIEPAPPEAELASLLTWTPGHVPPRFAVEVVSLNNSEKDYDEAPLKYARLGTRELVVFDPALLGPASRGGPHVLQIWQLDEQVTTMSRVYAGPGPARSAELGAWLLATPEHRLRIADDPDGHALWQTGEEEEAAGRRKEAAARRAEASARRAEAAARRKETAARKRAEEALRDSHRTAIQDLCELCGVPFDQPRRAHVASLDVAGLEALRTEIKRARAWPL